MSYQTGLPITRRLLAPVAIQGKGNVVVGVDVAAFVRRILLFDTYILQSVRLDDVALLAQTFGAEGLIELIHAGALRIYSDTYTIAETGRARADLNFSDNNKRLPLGSYSFSVLLLHDQEGKKEEQLEKLATLPGIGRSLGVDLRTAVQRNTISRPDSFSTSVFAGFYGDIRRDDAVLREAVIIELRKLGIKPKELSLLIEEVDPEDFRVQSNLQDRYGLSEQASHDMILRGLMAVATLNRRFAEMEVHSALSGIQESELSLLTGKLGAIAGLMDVQNNEKRFERVLELVGLQGSNIPVPRISAKHLLALRDSDECRAFRDWLQRTDSLSDHELLNLLKGVRARTQGLVASPRGKMYRFLLSNGVPLAMGLNGDPKSALVGLGLSALDMFLLEHLLPKNAIVSFLSDSYPSLFQLDK
jgi:hypothetical protein